MLGPMSIGAVSSGAAAAPAWDPSQPTTSGGVSPAFWWKADADNLKQASNGTGAVASDGDPVGYMEDLSGNGRHATQATADDRFTYKVNQVDGNAVARGDGVSDDLEFPNPMTGSTARTIFLHVKVTSATETTTCILDLNGLVNDPTFGSFFMITNEIAVRVGGGNRVFNAALGTTDYKVLTIQTPASANTNNIIARLDGVALGITSTVARALVTASAGGKIARSENGSGSTFTAMDLREAVGYTAELSTADMEEVEGYLLNP